MVEEKEERLEQTKGRIYFFSAGVKLIDPR